MQHFNLLLMLKSLPQLTSYVNADVKWLMCPVFLSETECDMGRCILKNQCFSVDCAQLTEASWITLPLNQFVGLSQVWCVNTFCTVKIGGQKERKNFRALQDHQVIQFNPSSIILWYCQLLGLLRLLSFTFVLHLVWGFASNILTQVFESRRSEHLKLWLH